MTRFNPQTRRYELLAIQRRETGEWAIPGGFVDPGEDPLQTSLREMREEAGVDLTHIPGHVLYRGYVDDPRSTDNAWIETTAVHRHLPEHEKLEAATAGDDAMAVKWLAIGEDMLSRLYANHAYFVNLALKRIEGQ